MIAGASLAFWLIITFFLLLRVFLSIYNWWSMRRLKKRIEDLEEKP